jgi:primary-amine oxidase
MQGVQPTFLDEELPEAGQIALADTRFTAAIQRRGLSVEDVFCLGLPPATLASTEEQNRRIAIVFCFVTRDATTMPWGRTVGGLTAMVDLNTREVLRVQDDGVVPIPSAWARYDSAAVGPTRAELPPIDVTLPRGAGFRVDGHRVSWDNWSFHYRVDPRVGLVLSLARFRDGDRWRSVMYEGSLSEMFVPYMDPARPFYAFSFMDAGEFSALGITKALAPGSDCPAHAMYFDAIVATSDGTPKTTANAACIFERASGDVAWRHRDILTESIESRPRRELVVRAYANLGNYDYLFDWVFQQDGAFRVRVGATGVVMTKPVAERDVRSMRAAAGPGAGTNGASAPDAYGRFVAPHMVAINHDHFLSFRLDLDVDGPQNSFLIDNLRTQRLPDGQPRRSVWTIEPVVAQTERDAMLHMDMNRPAAWRIINPAAHNAVGYPVSYQLVPEMNVMSLLSRDDYPRGRAGFTDYHLWVTPHRADERYAAGMYPTLSKPGEGLPKWTAANRPIDNRDIVVWYTFGMHHVVRAEDWPVMPVAWYGFELRPFDFFDRNRALDLRPLR